MNLKPAIAFVLTCVISVGLTTPAWAVEYNPGVSIGQWVKYGNVVAWGSKVPSEFNQLDWMKLEVAAVSGKEVTLHMSGKYGNGTAAREYDILFNVETGSLEANVSLGPEGESFSYLMAANLQKNYDLPGTQLTINRTETRSYLGTDRTVNIVNVTLFMTNLLDNEYFMVYDKISGVLLEMNIEQTSLLVPSEDFRMSFSVVDTNILTSSTPAGPSIDPIYIAAVIVTIVLVIVMVFLVLKRKKKPPIAELPAQTPEPKT